MFVYIDKVILKQYGGYKGKAAAGSGKKREWSKAVIAQWRMTSTGTFVTLLNSWFVIIVAHD